MVFAIAYFQPRPDFKAYIRMASTANTSDLVVKSPIVLVISLANVGTMPSTVDGWQLTVDLNKSRHHGTPVAVSPDIRARAFVPVQVAPITCLRRAGFTPKPLSRLRPVKWRPGI